MDATTPNNVAFVCTFTRKISRYSFTSHQFWKTNKNFANKNKLKQVTESIFSHYFLLENRFYTIKAFICRLQKRTSARSARIVVKFGFLATLTENDKKNTPTCSTSVKTFIVYNHWKGWVTKRLLLHYCFWSRGIRSLTFHLTVCCSPASSRNIVNYQLVISTTT